MCGRIARPYAGSSSSVSKVNVNLCCPVMSLMGQTPRDRRETIWFGSCYCQMFRSSLPCREEMDTNEKSWTADSTLLCCFAQTGLWSFGLNYIKCSVIYSRLNLVVIAKHIPKKKWKYIHHTYLWVIIGIRFSLIYGSELETSMKCVDVDTSRLS